MKYRHLLVLATFLLLAIALTWPLAAEFRDHVPGTATWSMDEYGYVWNHWWFKFAFIDRAENPFSTDMLFYPLGTSLVLYAYTLLHIMLALPLQYVFGLIPAVNATVLFSFVVSAYGMFLLAGYVVRVSLQIWAHQDGHPPEQVDPSWVTPAALLAGVVYAFSSNRFVYVSLGHYNVIATEWIPFYVLFLLKTLLHLEWRYPLLAGLFAAFALYSETTDGVLLALLTGVILVFEYRLVLRRETLARLATIAATAGVLFAPLLIPTLNEIFNSGYTLPGWGHAEKLLVDLNGFFATTTLNPFNRGWEQELDLVRQGTSRFSDINTFFVGFATALLALVGAIRYFRHVKLWVSVVLGFAFLSLGPLLHINGISEFDLDGLNVTFPMPFLALHYIPILRENRVPNRYSLVVLLGLAMLSGYAVYWLSSVLARRLHLRGRTSALAPTGLAVALGALVIGEHLAVPLPLTAAHIPPVYEQIGREPGEFAVLSLPLGFRNSFGQLGAEDTRTQYYQSAAGKALFSGQIQRNPPTLFEYFDSVPVLHSLLQLETYQEVSDEVIAEDKKAAPWLAYFFDIRYVVVNAAVPGRPPYSDTRVAVLDYVQKVFPLGEKVYDRDGVVAWRVNQAAVPAPVEIDLGTATARGFRADGWSSDAVIAEASANWIVGETGRLFFPAREVRDRTLVLRALPFPYPSAPVQRLTVLVNGRAIGTMDLDEGWQEYRVSLPATAIRAGLNEVRLAPAYRVRPRDVLPPRFAIGATGVNSPVDLLVQSTPEFGSIKINGHEVSPLKRGYNLAVIEAGTGRLLQVRNFDTGGSSVESRALNDWLTGLPSGVIVAGATQEESATSLGDRAVAQMRTLGVRTDLRKNPQATHAFVGVKGASAGSAAEATGGSSLVTIGHDADDRMLSVAIDWARIE